jgi:ABC-type antimicrobial peptide transport system permease subunit
MQPVIIAMKPVRNPMIFASYREGQTEMAIAHLEDLYKKFEPDFPMEWKLIDDPLEQLYRDEFLINKLAILFTIVAVAISILGLVGLVTYASETRRREIGIRKVMGASVGQILILLLKDFLLLITISFVVGTTIGWLASEQYLKEYAFRIQMDFWTVATTGTTLAAVTLLAVSYQSTKAAIASPAKTLKSE